MMDHPKNNVEKASIYNEGLSESISGILN